jgi:hypothetical protein
MSRSYLYQQSRGSAPLPQKMILLSMILSNLPGAHPARMSLNREYPE